MGRKKTEWNKKLVFLSSEKNRSLEGEFLSLFAMKQAVVKKPWAENPTLGAHSKPTQDGSHLGPDISLLGTLCHTSQVWWCQTHRAQLCTTSCCTGEVPTTGWEKSLETEWSDGRQSPQETVTWGRLLSMSRTEVVSQGNRNKTQSRIHSSEPLLNAIGHVFSGEKLKILYNKG